MNVVFIFGGNEQTFPVPDGGLTIASYLDNPLVRDTLGLPANTSGFRFSVDGDIVDANTVLYGDEEVVIERSAGTKG